MYVLKEVTVNILSPKNIINQSRFDGNLIIFSCSSPIPNYNPTVNDITYFYIIIKWDTGCDSFQVNKATVNKCINVLTNQLLLVHRRRHWHFVRSVCVVEWVSLRGKLLAVSFAHHEKRQNCWTIFKKH